MPVNKIVTKIDGVINKTINFNDLKAGLASGSHTITVEAFNGANLISTQTRNITIASSDTTAPTITTATVEDVNPNKLVVVFSEVVTITDSTGLTITGAATPTLSAPTGSGTDTITFTLSAALTNGQSVTLNVASSNTIKDAANNALAATTEAITNNVAASSTVDADYQAVLDYATAQSIALPDAAQQSIDNQLLIDYKATGAWVKDDCFMKFTGTASAAFKLIDWKRLITMVAYGSLTWSTTGAKGNGTNAYVDTKYIPATTGNNWSDTNAGTTVVLNNLGTIPGMVSGNKNGAGPETRIYNADDANDNFKVNNQSIYNELIIGLNGVYLNDSDIVSITNTTLTAPYGTYSPFSPQDEMYLFAYHRDNIAKVFSDVEISFLTWGADKRAEHAAIKTVLE